MRRMRWREWEAHQWMRFASKPVGGNTPEKAFEWISLAMRRNKSRNADLNSINQSRRTDRDSLVLLSEGVGRYLRANCCWNHCKCERVKGAIQNRPYMWVNCSNEPMLAGIVPPIWLKPKRLTHEKKERNHIRWIVQLSDHWEPRDEGSHIGNQIVLRQFPILQDETEESNEHTILLDWGELIRRQTQ